jgi:hypothetical protein
MDKNQMGASQGKTYDDEPASEDQGKPLARSSKPQKGNCGEGEGEDPAGELKLRGE